MPIQDRVLKSDGSYLGGESLVADGKNLSSQRGTASVTASVSGEGNDDIRNRPSVKSMSRNALHELDHKAGLVHPWRSAPMDIRTSTNEYRNQYKLIPKELRDKVLNNIMNSDENVLEQLRSAEGREITPGQIKTMKSIIEKEQNVIQNQNSTNENSNNVSGQK